MSGGSGDQIPSVRFTSFAFGGSSIQARLAEQMAQGAVAEARRQVEAASTAAEVLETLQATAANLPLDAEALVEACQPRLVELMNRELDQATDFGIISELSRIAYARAFPDAEREGFRSRLIAKLVDLVKARTRDAKTSAEVAEALRLLKDCVVEDPDGKMTAAAEGRLVDLVKQEIGKYGAPEEVTAVIEHELVPEAARPALRKLGEARIAELKKKR